MRTPFKSLCRVDLLLRGDAIDALRRAGAQIVWVGAESGSQSVLDAMDKGTKVEQAVEAARRLHEAGIRVGFFLQFGYPGETRDDIAATFRLVRDGAAGRHRHVRVLSAARHEVLSRGRGSAGHEAELGRLERSRHDVSRTVQHGLLPQASPGAACRVPDAPIRGARSAPRRRVRRSWRARRCTRRSFLRYAFSSSSSRADRTADSPRCRAS